MHDKTGVLSKYSRLNTHICEWNWNNLLKTLALSKSIHFYGTVNKDRVVKFKSMLPNQLEYINKPLWNYKL